MLGTRMPVPETPAAAERKTSPSPRDYPLHDLFDAGAHGGNEFYPFLTGVGDARYLIIFTLPDNGRHCANGRTAQGK